MSCKTQQSKLIQPTCQHSNDVNTGKRANIYLQLYIDAFFWFKELFFETIECIDKYPVVLSMKMFELHLRKDTEVYHWKVWKWSVLIFILNILICDRRLNKKHGKINKEVCDNIL